jgi:hypothetical protein
MVGDEQARAAARERAKPAHVILGLVEVAGAGQGFDADPRRDLSSLARPTAVVLGGRPQMPR